MNGERLRDLQAPLKERYRHDPASARVTLSASGRIDRGSVTCSLETGKPGRPAGLHPAAGGDGLDACSGDVMLEALTSCAGPLAAVATAMGIDFASATVTAEGDLDFRGTLGVARDAPVGFSALRVSFLLDTQAPTEKVAKLLELTERYGVVFQTLTTPPTIAVQVASSSAS